MITQVSTELDIKLLARLAREIWEEHYTPIIGAEQVEYMLDKYQSPAAITDQINTQGYLYYLLMQNKSPVGYLALHPQDNDILFLSKIYLKKEFRGQGLSKEMFVFAEEYAREHELDTLKLTVNKGNSDSIRVYEKMGFINTGPIAQKIGAGYVMDDWVFKKKLY